MQEPDGALLLAAMADILDLYPALPEPWENDERKEVAQACRRSNPAAGRSSTGSQKSPARPCVVLAGQVLVGTREMRAMGVESAYSMADLVGLDTALRQPRDSLVELGARVARTWSR